MKNGIVKIVIRFAVILLVVSSLFAILFATEAMSGLQLSSSDYARITDVEYKAVVLDDAESGGTVLVTERLTFDVHASSTDNLYWELWRELPEYWVDGLYVDYTVISVKQILEDGTEIIYEESPQLYWDDEDYLSSNTTLGPGKWYHSEGPYNESLARYECVLFYVDGLYQEEVVFEVEYEIHNVALRYGDCSDLYLAMYSGSTINYLNSFKAEILFPNEVMPSSGNYEVYTYGTNAGSFTVSESADANPGYYTLSFSLDEDQLQFKSYNEFIEFELVAYGEDKHIFTEYATANYYSEDNVLDEITSAYLSYTQNIETVKTLKMAMFIVCAACAAVVVIYCFTADHRIRKKYTFYKPDVDIERFNGIEYNLDPNFASFLVFCRHATTKTRPKVYFALLLSLACKDYIKIEEPINGIIMITLLKTDEESQTPEEHLTTCEASFYNLLVRHSNNKPITLDHFLNMLYEDYENTNAFVAEMERSIIKTGVDEGYFQKADYAEPQYKLRSEANLLLVLGFVAIFLNITTCFTRLELIYGGFFLLGGVLILGSCYLKSIASQYILFTQYGENEYARWRSFYNWLKSEAFNQDDIVIDTTEAEKYLIYAEAFGLSEKILGAIAQKCPDVPDTSILYFTHHHHMSFLYYRRSFRSQRIIGGHHGGARSGGRRGHGGGGRGGGGGGGGH